MKPYVFKQKGSSIYRVRYTLSSGPRLYDKPPHTHIKEVAEAKAAQLSKASRRFCPLKLL